MSTAIYMRSALPNPAGMAAQQEQCEAYAREHGLTVTRLYTDLGPSRQGFDALLGDVSQEGIETLVVYSLDRLGREAGTSTRSLTALNEAGVTLHTVREGVTTADSFMLNVLSQVAAYDDEHGDYDDEFAD